MLYLQNKDLGRYQYSDDGRGDLSPTIGSNLQQHQRP